MSEDAQHYNCWLAQEWEVSKKRQEAQLDRVERGVGTLADMARGMQASFNGVVSLTGVLLQHV